ncbi:hypothetical protein KKH81_01870 [Patescibacteria group bacterium]|nr:hypothetical protein [Patescibacteria group bacterium]
MEKDAREKFEQVDARFDQIDKKFEAVDARFDQINERFRAVDVRFDAIDRKFDALFEYMQKQFAFLLETMNEGFDRLSVRATKAELRLEDVEERTGIAERAIDTDAVTIVDHEHRITRLEAA